MIRADLLAEYRDADDGRERVAERDPLQLALIHMNISRELSRRLRDTDDLLLRAVMGEPLRGGDGEPLLRVTPANAAADTSKNV